MPSALRAPSPIATPDEGESAADCEPPIGLSVDIVHEAGEWPPLAPLCEKIDAAAAALAAEIASAQGEACIALSGDEHVALLNGAYRGKPAPTNVLSFPARAEGRDDAPGRRFLGDIVLAAETVKREAEDLGLPLDHHIQHLVVHGLLHLLGFDHEADDEAQAMEAIEVRALARLGVADPYLPARADHSEAKRP